MILLDTHVLIWAMRQPEKLSITAKQALNQAPARCISAASLYEITLKARLGKWPEVEDLLQTDLAASLEAGDIEIMPADAHIMQQAGSLDWKHRDPFDRLIVTTALQRELPIISKDITLDTLENPGGLVRIW